MKVVRIINTATATPVTHETNATTLGQLKAELQAIPAFSRYDWANVAIYQKDSTGRSTKSLNEESISSEQSFSLFITPAKHKGGANTTRYTDETIAELKVRMVNVLDDVLGLTATAVPVTAPIIAPVVTRLQELSDEIKNGDENDLESLLSEHNLAIDYDDFGSSYSEVERLRATVYAHMGITPPSANDLTADEKAEIARLAR
jgi:hypothetical protein